MVSYPRHSWFDQNGTNDTDEQRMACYLKHSLIAASVWAISVGEASSGKTEDGCGRGGKACNEVMTC